MRKTVEKTLYRVEIEFVGCTAESNESPDVIWTDLYESRQEAIGSLSTNNPIRQMVRSAAYNLYDDTQRVNEIMYDYEKWISTGLPSGVLLVHHIYGRIVTLKAHLTENNT